jgi:hypothetical protein
MAPTDTLQQRAWASKTAIGCYLLQQAGEINYFFSRARVDATIDSRQREQLGDHQDAARC